MLLMGLHILSLHLMHSQNPLQLKGNGVSFHPFFMYKDFVLLLGGGVGLVMISYFGTLIFLERDMFFPSNPMLSPEHIVPE